MMMATLMRLSPVLRAVHAALGALLHPRGSGRTAPVPRVLEVPLLAVPAELPTAANVLHRLKNLADTTTTGFDSRME